MRSLKQILESILGSIEADLDQNFPDEIVEMISLWQKVRWTKYKVPTYKQFQAEPDELAFEAFYGSQNLLEKIEGKQVAQAEARSIIRQKDDVVIISMSLKYPYNGIYLYYAKTEECLRIFEEPVVDDRGGGYVFNPTVFIRQSNRVNMLYDTGKSSRSYIVLPGACWGPLKKVLMP